MSEHIVLLVDGDSALSERTQAALKPYGCRCVLIYDSNETLNYQGQPSLIVLCIDPKRTGWAVCNKLKKHPVLRSVPLIITSAEASEKDFEDHKKLKTRAEEYERKPYPVEKLVDKVRALLGGLEVQVSGEFELPEEEISVDDAIEVVEDLQDFDDELSDRTRVADVSALLEQETEAAFASIAADEGRQPPPEPDEFAAGEAMSIEAEPPPGVYSVPTVTRQVSATDLGLDMFAPDAPTPGVAQEPIAPPEPEPLPEPDEAAALREERDHLVHDLAELRGRLERSGPVTSAPRDVLTLRETINKKEKEILDLKDALDAKEREILNGKERLRDLDRSRRDLDEKALSVEKDLIEAQEKLEALARDKELGHERERGLKGRLEDAQKKLERSHAEVAEWKARHAAEADAARATLAEAESRAQTRVDEAQRVLEAERAQLAQATADEKADLQGRLAEAEEQGRTLVEAVANLRMELAGREQAQAQGLAAVEEKARQELAESEEKHKQDLVAADRQHQQELGRADEALRSALEAADAEKARALEEAAVEKQQALAAAAAEKEQALAAAAAEREQALAAAAADQQQAVAAAGADKDRALAAAAADKQQALEEASVEKQQALAAAAAEKEQALAAAIADREQALAAAVAAERERALEGAAAERQQALAAAAADKEQALVAAAADKDQTLAAAAAGKEEALEAARRAQQHALEERDRAHQQATEELERRHAEASAAFDRHFETARAESSGLRADLDAERNANRQLTAELAEARQTVAQRDQRIAELELENGSFQEQILKAYHRLKSDETIVARARKALAIAATLLDDNLAETKESKTS